MVPAFDEDHHRHSLNDDNAGCDGSVDDSLDRLAITCSSIGGAGTSTAKTASSAKEHSKQRKFAGLRDSLAMASARRRSKGFHIQRGLDDDNSDDDNDDEEEEERGAGDNGTANHSTSGTSNPCSDGNNKKKTSNQKRKKGRNPFRRSAASAAASADPGSGASRDDGRRRHHPGPTSSTLTCTSSSANGNDAGGDQYEPPPSFDLSSPPLSASAMSSTADENAKFRPSSRSESRSQSRSRSRSRSRSILRSVSRHMPTGRSRTASGGRGRKGSKGGHDSKGTYHDGSFDSVKDGDDCDYDYDEEDDDGDSEEEEEDPLIDLFEMHNRRRVVFDPTFAPPPPSPSNPNRPGNSYGKGERGGKAGADGGFTRVSSSSSFNIKGFMNRIIHKGGRESAVEVVDDDEIASFMATDKTLASASASAPADGPTGTGAGIRTDIAPESPPKHAVSNLAARPTSSALRSGRRGSGKFVSSSTPTTSPPSSSSSAAAAAAVTSFDPFLIDKAKSRSTTTAAVANAAFSRSTRFDGSVKSNSDTAAMPSSPSAATPGAGKFSYKNFRQRGSGCTDNAAVGVGGRPMAAIKSSRPFQEDPQVSKRIERLLGRANRAHTRTYRYEHAIGYYLAALEMLTKEEYPESHELVTRAVRKLNDCHHAQSSLKNSAKIVKMGIKHENRGEFVRALKMYTIAYRIRRDALSKFHPSLPVLLNMLGSVQVKRGELKEAMQIYELALNGRPDDMKSVSERRKAEMIHPLTKSVTLRDMGMIYERWGDDDKALQLYEESLDFVARNHQQETLTRQQKDDVGNYGVEDGSDFNKFSRSFLTRSRSTLASAGPEPSDKEHVSCGNDGELEVYLETGNEMFQTGTSSGSDGQSHEYIYDDFFPPMGGGKKSKNLRGKNTKKKAEAGNGGREGSDVNVAITLHQIAQINRRRGQHNVALSAYQVALRGMKQALGDRHPNVAAILGNLGNLYKDMGRFDEAYGIYQEVLSIETHHLGLSHPEVSITLHNIATIESSRGRYSDAINLYTQVIKMQKSLFGPNHISAAVTSSCMGDVYERMGNTKKAMDMYEETLRIRSEIMGRQHVDVGRLLHKLGCLSLERGDCQNAEVYVTKAAAIYLLNDLKEDHPWMRDIRRNEADIKGLLATTGLNQDNDDDNGDCGEL